MGKFSRHTKEKAEDLPLSSIDKSRAKISTAFYFTCTNYPWYYNTILVLLLTEFSRAEEDLEWNSRFSCIFCLNNYADDLGTLLTWVLLRRKYEGTRVNKLWLNICTISKCPLEPATICLANIAFQSWKISGNEFTNNNWMPEGPFTKINYSICTLATQHFSRQIGKHCSAISFHRVEERDKEVREIISLFF